MESARDYYRRCVAAADEQGLYPAVGVLVAAGIPVTLDQTGGMSMVLRAIHPDPTRTTWCGIVLKEEADEEQGHGPLYSVVRYPAGDWDGTPEGTLLAETAALDDLVGLVSQ